MCTLVRLGHESGIKRVKRTHSAYTFPLLFPLAYTYGGVASPPFAPCRVGVLSLLPGDRTHSLVLFGPNAVGGSLPTGFAFVPSVVEIYADTPMTTGVLAHPRESRPRRRGCAWSPMPALSSGLFLRESHTQIDTTSGVLAHPRRGGAMSSRGGARGRVVPYQSILKTNRTHVAPAERKAGEAGRDPTSHGWRVGTSDVQPGFANGTPSARSESQRGGSYCTPGSISQSNQPVNKETTTVENKDRQSITERLAAGDKHDSIAHALLMRRALEEVEQVANWIAGAEHSAALIQQYIYYTVLARSRSWSWSAMRRGGTLAASGQAAVQGAGQGLPPVLPRHGAELQGDGSSGHRQPVRVQGLDQRR